MATFRGTAAGDTLRGTLDADTIFGFGGNDDVLARAGNDTVSAGDGSDTVNGEQGNDRVSGDAGTDNLTGGQGNDRVFGGTGNDLLSDRANGPDGNDVFDGGAGLDRVSFEGQAVGVRLTLAEGGAESRAVQGGEVDVVRAVEGVDGSSAADVIFGNSGANDLEGFGGDNRIFGRGGNDSVSGTGLVDGGAGNDLVFGGAGAVRLFGGTGADNLTASGETAPRGGGVDRNNLGSDSARDTFNAGIQLDQDGDFSFGFGVESVANVGAQDQFNINFGEVGTFLQAGDFIDSDGNGVINNADRDARLVGGNLVLDFDQLFERLSTSPADLGEQHVILERIASIDADQFL